MFPCLASGVPEDPASSIEAPFGASPATLRQHGYASLFDGKTLAGWRKAGGTGKFRVEDGAIVVEKTDCYVPYLVVNVFYVGALQETIASSLTLSLKGLRFQD